MGGDNYLAGEHSLVEHYRSNVAIRGVEFMNSEQCEFRTLSGERPNQLYLSLRALPHVGIKILTFA